MDLVEDLADRIVPITTACQALGVSRAMLYRARGQHRRVACRPGRRAHAA